MSYNGHDLEQGRYGVAVGGPVRDWEPGLGEVEVPPSPVRSIPITPQLAAADEARRKAREAGNSSDWTIKATLSEENLRRVRVQVSPGRSIVSVADATKHLCACGARVSKARIGRCQKCFAAARERMPKPLCEGCGAVVTKRKVKFCRKCVFSHRAGRVEAVTPERIPTEETAAATGKVRKEMKRQVVTYKVGPPVSEANVPASLRGRHRVSPYLPIYQSARRLKAEEFLPLTVEVGRQGLLIGQALRKMAEKDGKAVEQRRSEDGLTFWFRIIDKPEKP